MQTFSYKAINKAGENETGIVDAASSFAAGHILAERGLTVLNVTETGKKNFLELLNNISTVPLKEKIAFIQNLDLLLRSGVSAPRAMRIISEQTKNKKFKSVVTEMSSDVESGKSLTETLKKFPEVFSHIFVSMVEVGELSGNLEKSLEYLRIQLQRQADLKAKTKGAMIYPTVILVAMLIIGTLLTIFVLPGLTATFKDAEIELPIMTRIVIAFTDFAAGNSVLVIIGMIVAAAGIVFGLRTKQGKQFMSLALLNLPAIKDIVTKVNIAQFSRIMSSLMKSGVSVVQGLQVTGESLDNYYYRNLILDAAEKVKLGNQLTMTLNQNEKLFPTIVTQMLSVGEETGNLEQIMDQVAEHFEMEIDDTMKNLSSIIEPVLLLVIGGVVGFLAIALMMPIYNMSQAVS
ncbi:MAG: type II secretion system F family protein [Candidatus Doudnabacteria bacterium]